MYFNPLIFTLYINFWKNVDLKTEINQPPLLFAEVRLKQKKKKNHEKDWHMRDANYKVFYGDCE